jgi:hypothetical protein
MSRAVLVLLRGVATIFLFVAGVAATSDARSEILESVTEDIAQARGREFAKSKGGPDNNKLTNTVEHVRAGKSAFKHWVNTKGERSELAMQRTKIGGTYWYGWSMMLPADFDHRGSDTIVMQLASWPTPRNGKFPHSANGPYLEIQPDGRLIMHLQHKEEKQDMVCDDFVVAEDVAKLKGKWLDFVMHARWTGDADGIFKLWMKIGADKVEQKVDYTGPTWWNDEDTGPYLKLGAYMGEPGWRGPAERTVYIDEYRLGDEKSSFDEVAPPSFELKQHGDSMTFQNPSGKALLRYEYKGAEFENLSVESLCFFHPFATPSRVVMTEVAPADHPHHRGIFLAFVEMHGEKDADFWGWGQHAPTKGRVIVNQSNSLLTKKPQSFIAHNHWVADGVVMIEERLAAQPTVHNPQVHLLDLHYTLTPVSDINLSQWAFSGFCVRTRKDAKLVAYGPKGEVTLPNPSHLKPETDWPAEPWYAYELEFTDGKVAGIAVIDHPHNPPSLWHNHREIRMLNPCIVAPAAVKLREGEPLVLRYRVVAYDGPTQTGELDRLADEFAKMK